MRVHVLQHVPFEGIANMSVWLHDNGAEVNYTRFFEGASLPELNDIDLIIIMGGPMSINDESTYPWLRFEKQFISEAVKKGVAILGVCLGAQLIAAALGARVYQNTVKEIGWFPVESTPIPDDVFRFPEKCTVFHWHGETFDLPPDAIRLAKSTACENQAFQVGRKIIGLQFHLETTPESANAILDNCADELIPGPYVQTEPELREVASSAYKNVNDIMNRVLSYLTSA